MIKIRVALLVLATCLILPLVTVGCGTLDVNFHTTIKPSGDITQQIRIEGSGMLGSMIEELENLEDLDQEGWQVTTKRTEDSTSLVATKDFKQDESIIFGNDTVLEGVSARITDNLFVKSYSYEATIPGGGPIDTGNGDEFADLGQAMVEGMFNISWTFTLPGKITESNADFVEGNSATWYFDLDNLQNDRYLMVQSRYINWPVIIGIIAGVLVITSLVIFIVIRARKRRTEALYSVE